MKKIVSVLWIIFAISILIFVISVFVANSNAIIWRVFSFAMPIAAVSFWGAIILSAIDYFGSKKEK